MTKDCIKRYRDDIARIVIEGEGEYVITGVLSCAFLCVINGSTYEYEISFEELADRKDVHFYILTELK